MLLKPMDEVPSYAKIAFQGGAGSGKTTTATMTACGLWRQFESKKPIAFFDTEGGAAFVADRIREATGTKPLYVKSHRFDDLLQVVDECLAGAADVLLVDSISHVWKELCDAHLAGVNAQRAKYNNGPKVRLDLQDWAPIKNRWAEFATQRFLNSPLHMVVCGRVSNTFSEVENEDTGKTESRATGTKMRAEGDFGYEANLIVEMTAVQIPAKKVKGKSTGGKVAHQGSTIVPTATVLKDRFDKINGHVIEWPTYESFAPHLALLKPAGFRPAQVEAGSAAHVDDRGRDDRKQARDMALERIEGALTMAFPSTGGADKKAKLRVLLEVFGTVSWTEISQKMPLVEVQKGALECEYIVQDLEAAAKDGIEPLVALDGAIKNLADRRAKPPAMTSAEVQKQKDIAEDLDAALAGKGRKPVPAVTPSDIDQALNNRRPAAASAK